jgi:hypothetical protein
MELLFLKEKMMPQHLLKVSAAYAKSFFGTVIGAVPSPSSEKEGSILPAPKAKIVRTGGNVPPVFPKAQPKEPPEKDLF